MEFANIKINTLEKKNIFYINIYIYILCIKICINNQISIIHKHFISFRSWHFYQTCSRPSSWIGGLPQSGRLATVLRTVRIDFSIDSTKRLLTSSSSGSSGNKLVILWNFSSWMLLLKNFKKFCTYNEELKHLWGIVTVYNWHLCTYLISSTTLD